MKIYKQVTMIDTYSDKKCSDKFKKRRRKFDDKFKSAGNSPNHDHRVQK